MTKRRRADVDATARSARFDFALTELFAGTRYSIVVGVTLADAWSRARTDWPNIGESFKDDHDGCVVEVDGQCVMLLPLAPTFDVFAHEAVHIAIWVMTSRGIPVFAKNEEVIAYLVQWVTQHGWPAASGWLPRPVSDITAAVAL